MIAKPLDLFIINDAISSSNIPVRAGYPSLQMDVLKARASRCSSVKFKRRLIAVDAQTAICRSLMRLPWSSAHSDVIRVNLEPFDQPPDEIH
jgi:hypothetical protein